MDNENDDDTISPCLKQVNRIVETYKEFNELGFELQIPTNPESMTFEQMFKWIADLNQKLLNGVKTAEQTRKFLGY